MATALPTRDLDQLRRTFGGDVITPVDAAYDEARRLWNAVHDRRPAVIVRPTKAAEVATAIRFGRDQALEIAVRSGGHSAPGLVGSDGGLIVDLSAMRGVVVDPAARTARANGGALLGELDIGAQEHGLVCPVGVVGHTGVAGLTLGGGIGRLQRQFGLTIDNLTAVELVTADGRLVRATSDDEPELFWGLRGAGWNFGIATAFEFRLQPFGPHLHRGFITFPASEIQHVWATFAEYARNASDAVSAMLVMTRAGAHDGYPEELVGRPIVYLAYNHSGPADAVARDTAGLHAGQRPVHINAASEPYLDVQTAHDLALGWGSRSIIRSINADDVRSGAFDELVELVATSPDGASFSITALGGAIGRLDEDATAYAGRTARFDLSADSAWDDPALDDTNRDWVRRVLAVVAPDAGLGGYANGNEHLGPDGVRRLYGDAKLVRLAALKRCWDPDNVFHVNHNVVPAAGA